MRPISGTRGAPGAFPDVACGSPGVAETHDMVPRWSWLSSPEAPGSQLGSVAIKRETNAASVDL